MSGVTSDWCNEPGSVLRVGVLGSSKPVGEDIDTKGSSASRSGMAAGGGGEAEEAKSDGVDMGRAEPLASDVSRRIGDFDLLFTGSDVTKLKFSPLSRIPLITPVSMSSSNSGRDDWEEISSVVGNVTGRGAGGLVTEIVGMTAGALGESSCICRWGG